MESKHIFSNGVKNRLSIHILLIFSLIYSFSFVLWTDVPDGYYWYNQTLFYNKEGLVTFALWLGYIWRCIWGDNFLYMKILGWGLTITSILLPYFLLLSHKERKENLAYLAWGIILMGCWTNNIYSPDTISVFIMIVLLIIMFRFGINNKWILLCYSLLTAILLLSRMPNITFLPVAATYYYLANKEKSFNYKCRLLLAYFTLALFLYYLLLVLITGRVDILSFQKEILYSMSESSPEHGIPILIKHYIGRGVHEFCIICTFIGCLFVCYWLKLLEGSILKRIVPLILFLYLIVPTRGWYESINFLSGCSLCLLIMIFYKYPKHQLEVLFVTAIGFVCIAGSDTGIYKLFYWYKCFFPLMLICYKDKLKDVTIKMFAVSYTLFSIYSFSIPYLCKFRNWTTFNHIYQLKTDEELIDARRKLTKVSCLALKDHIIFYGLNSAHFMYAATNTKPLYKNSYWFYESNKSEIESIKAILSYDKQCTFFDYTNSVFIQEEMKKIDYVIVESDVDGNVYKSAI